jgi:hypothetical protein
VSIFGNFFTMNLIDDSRVFSLKHEGRVEGSPHACRGENDMKELSSPRHVGAV